MEITPCGFSISKISISRNIHADIHQVRQFCETHRFMIEIPLRSTTVTRVHSYSLTQASCFSSFI